ncbi:11325_t:CDS:2, partial [Gigaspora rosea]
TSSGDETYLIRLSHLASKFLKENLEALKIEFRPASSEDAVIPAVNSMLSDKHLKNRMLLKTTDFKEVQLAAEILACSSVNLREIYKGEYVDQELFAIRVISTYFTFYHAVITGSYWEELDLGLPKKQLTTIERWPPKNGKDEGLDIAQIGGRKAVLTALAKIREYLLQ